MTGAYEWILDAVIGFCLLLILLNWAGLISWYRARTRRQTKLRFSFALPFIWGVGGSIAILLYPRAAVRWFFWLPLVLDPSIGLVFGVIAWRKASRWFQHA